MEGESHGILLFLYISKCIHFIRLKLKHDCKRIIPERLNYLHVFALGMQLKTDNQILVILILLNSTEMSPRVDEYVRCGAVLLPVVEGPTARPHHLHVNGAALQWL